MSHNTSPADAQQHWKTQQVSKQVHFLLHDLTAAADARNRLPGLWPCMWVLQVQLLEVQVAELQALRSTRVRARPVVVLCGHAQRSFG